MKENQETVNERSDFTKNLNMVYRNNFKNFFKEVLELTNSDIQRITHRPKTKETCLYEFIEFTSVEAKRSLK